MKMNFPSKKEILSIPNIMGYFRIALLPFIAYGILNNLYVLQIVLLLISALTDFLDGKIARRFNMVTELGKALDPVADKLTLCILFGCLMFKNEYARVIAIVMLIKEFYMLVMQLVLKHRCGKTSGSAKWYGKICTASLFLTLALFLIVPYMTALLSNILMLTVIFIMVYTMIMYGYLFRSVLKNTSDICIKSYKNKPDKRIHPAIRAFFFTLLGIVIYLAAGATLPFINHQKVNAEYEAAFRLEDYVSASDLTAGELEEGLSEEGSFIAGSDRVRLVSTNDEALYERIRLIDMAKDSIILSSFDFRADESGSDVIAALCDAADRGVSIQILVDGFSGLLKMDGQNAFYHLASKSMVQIRIYNPVNILEPWNLMGRMHDKYLIVDDYGYLLGGRNTYDLFLGSYQSSYKNQDLEVFVWNEGKLESSSINQIKAYFNSVWQLSYSKPYHYPSFYADSKMAEKVEQQLTERITRFRLKNSDILSAVDSVENTFSAGKIQLISNPVHRNNKEPYVWNTLCKLMNSAKERVYLHTPYIICSKEMYHDLTEIGDKNIDTRLLLNAPENGANVFGCSDYISEKSNVLATGFQIYEYMGAYSYHAKALLIDQNLSVIGSYNADMRSTYLDTELMLTIESPALNQELEAVMRDAEAQSKYTISEDEAIIPVSVQEAVLSKKDRIKNMIVIFFTRPIRFLL